MLYLKLEQLSKPQQVVWLYCWVQHVKRCWVIAHSIIPITGGSVCYNPACYV